ncbi:hypothetical protein Bra3105_06570 [Brachybacterium halotolerans subsp. kimchii]|uniref:hypothetical protein n=1 Tax=Brachybacterium halotolerans TaxID=2795215 RepID=UPI001E39036C|nr:hypothetical protein [Brachybacterium halotolerans]UEJ83970.1 hypothetical protein Bra3105_06570 [Brachybacterium halotolerans subsp. kimchii]
MTQHTADEFAKARFATHPDGRIAARVNPADALSWVCSRREVSSDFEWRGNAAMARDGWSPLDETRTPRVATDEGAARGVRALRTMFPESLSRLSSQGLDNLVRVAVNAALSAAPTTDEDAGIGPETRAAYRELHTPTTDKRKPLVRMADWEEAITRAQQAEATAERYGRTIDKLQVRIKELEARAKRAEQERDSWRSQVPLAEWEKDLIENRPLTAREHLDAAIALMDAKR